MKNIIVPLLLCACGKDGREEALRKACDLLAAGGGEERSSTNNTVMGVNVLYNWSLDASGTAFGATGSFAFANEAVHYFLVTPEGRVDLPGMTSRDDLGRQCSGQLQGYGWRLRGTDKTVALNSSAAAMQLIVVENADTGADGGGSLDD